MPVFFQHIIDENTRLGIWRIEESEEFFLGTVPLQKDVTHPHKRLQHLAGRFLLQYLFPGFPYKLIKIADTRKPYLPEAEYHFSISHCGDFAAAIVSKDKRVGIDIEIPVERILKVKDKFLSEDEKEIFGMEGDRATSSASGFRTTTVLWSCKEAVFKWHGDGGVGFKEHIHLQKDHEGMQVIDCFFSKLSVQLEIHYRLFDHIVLTWVTS